MQASKCLISLLVLNHMTSLSNISNPAKHAYTDNVKHVVGIKPAMEDMQR